MEIKIESLENKLYKNNFSFYNLAHFSTSILLISLIIQKNIQNIDVGMIFLLYIINLFFIKKACDEKNRDSFSYIIFGIFFPIICSIILLFTPNKRLEIKILDIKSIDDLLVSLIKYRNKLKDKNQIYNAALISKVIVDNFKHKKDDEYIYIDLVNQLSERPEYKIIKNE